MSETFSKKLGRKSFKRTIDTVTEEDTSWDMSVENGQNDEQVSLNIPTINETKPA